MVPLVEQANFGSAIGLSEVVDLGLVGENLRPVPDLFDHSTGLKR